MSLRKKTVSGVKWTTISTITLAVTGILKISVLARFLDAADFGLMALVTFVLGFMNLFMDMGLTSAILHKQDITSEEYASLYWINVLFSVILFGLITVASPAISSFYNEPELTILIPLTSLSIIFSALGRQFKTVEQKELNFRYIATTDIIGAIAGLIVAIVLAVNGYGVYSLVFGALTQYAISNFIYFLRGLIKFGMLFHFNYTETKPFLSIGIYQVGGQVINYFNRDLDILLIGKFFGAEVLGGYSLAKQLVKKPMTILNPIITKVASPVLALMQSDKKLLKNKFLALLNIVSTLNFTAYGLMILFAYPIVLLLYGSDFTHIVLLVQILSGYMFVRSVASPVGSLVVATGRTDYEFYWNLAVLLIMPLAIYVGALFTVEAVAFSLFLTMALLLIPFWKLLIYKLSGAGMGEFFISIFPNYNKALRNIKTI